MRKIKVLIATLLLAGVASLGALPAYAGDGAVETPGLTATRTVKSSGTTGAVETPGLMSTIIIIYLGTTPIL